MAKIPRLYKSKLTFKKIATLAVLLFIAITILYFLRMNSSPNEGQIKVSRAESAASTSNVRYLPLATSYFELLYPDKYALVSDQPSAEYLAKFISSNSNSKQTLEITLKSAPHGGITLDSDYKFYQSNLSTYKMSNSFYGAEAVVFATKKSGGEQNALWLHEKHLLIVKMKDNLTDAELNQQMKDILSSVQWR